MKVFLKRLAWPFPWANGLCKGLISSTTTREGAVAYPEFHFEGSCKGRGPPPRF